MSNSHFVYANPPVASTHSGLDLFDNSNILVDFQRGYHEEIFTGTSPDGPVLEFEFQGAKTEVGGTVVDLVNTFLKLEVSLKPLENLSEEEIAIGEKIYPTFVNNLMHSMFQNVEVVLNGTTVSSSNNMYAYKALIEAELSHNESCKKGWLKCQGYEYEQSPNDLKSKPFQNRKKLYKGTGGTMRGKWHYYARLSDNFLCGTNKFLLPGVDVRIRLYRSPDQFVLIHDNDAKDTAGKFALEVKSTSLMIHKLELKNETFLSIERALAKKAAQYDFREMVGKTFLITDGVNQFYKDDIFNRAPISRLVVALVPESSYSGNYSSNPFHFAQLGLETVRLTREGSLVGGTPMKVGDSLIRAYYTTLKSLGFDHGGNGIPLDDYPQHFNLVFELTADSRLDDDTIRPELTGARLGIELNFKPSTNVPIRLILLGERRSIVLIDRNREIVKNSKVFNG